MITKKILTFVLITLGINSYAQIPPGYYNSATGIGYTLKTQLKSIISNGHIDQGYSALYDAYLLSDNDSFYENDNTVLDMYSENPSGSDSYNYNHNDRTCGNYNSENDCYNREHIFPQGFFNEQLPMRTDIHHVVPTDGYVNNRRANYPFGEVTNDTWISNNGSKVGQNTFGSYSGIVFEPIDEFKGDIARMLLYFAVRYEDEVTDNSWDNHTITNNPLNGTNNQVYEVWYLQLLYKWHNDDPVSAREIKRNNEAYNFQGNRNPFIDYPEYVDLIWGALLSNPEYSLNNQTTIYPNPTVGNYIQIINKEKVTVKIYSILGKELLKKTIYPENSQLDISSINRGIYIVKISNNSSSINRKFIKK
ncbi:endonuclease [Flavobacteriaceae bacterium]|nr:endonuclease [Flavobacteriaceae bacterium]